MKDFDVAPYWGWLAVALITLAVPLVVMVEWPPAHDAQYPVSTMPAVAGIVIAAALFALLVPVGLKKGDVGANKYGDATAT